MSIIEPNFFIIGAPKCGTTTMHAWLSQSPSVYMPTLKELRFYSDDDLFSTMGFKDYLEKFFSGVEDETAVGEATPAYLQNAGSVIPRMKATLAHPEMLRFVVLLRNPADRAFSHYLHAKRSEAESRAFAECVFDVSLEKLDLSCRYVSESLYSSAVETWLNNFDRNQFFFARLKDLNSGDLRNDIARFLHISPDGLSPEVKIANSQATARSKSAARFLVKDSALKRLGKQLLPPVARNRLRVAITSVNTRISKERQQLDPLTRTKMLRALSSDITRLEELTGLDLKDWKTEVAGAL